MDYKVISLSKDDSLVKIYKITKNNNISPNKINIELAYLPFGIEQYSNKYYLNIQLDFNKSNNNKHIGLLYDIEKHFIEYMNKINDKLKFVSSIKKKNEHFILLKLSLPIIKNNFISKFFIDNKKTNILELKKNSSVNIIIKLNTLWIYNHDFGINWIADSIFF